MTQRFSSRRRRPCSFRPTLEVLEDRITPSGVGMVINADPFTEGMAGDSAGNQYVNYVQVHGTVALDPARTHFVTGLDFATPVGGNGHFLVKYSPTEQVLWVKSQAAGEVPNNVRTLKVAADSTGEHLYLTALGGPLTKMELDGTVDWSISTPGGSVSSCVIDAADGSIYVNGTNAQGEFVAKLAPNDGSTVWTQEITATGSISTGAAPGNVYLGTVALANGIVYASGVFSGTLTAGTSTLTDQKIDSTSTSPDGFIAAYDTSGNLRSLAQFIDAQVTTVRAFGSDVYLTANFGNTADLDPGTGQKLLTPGTSNSLAVARLNYTTVSAPTLTWAEKFVDSGAWGDIAYGLEVSGTGTDLYVSGAFGGTTNFNPSGTYNLTAGGGDDIFAMKLDAATGGLTWVSQMGSTLQLNVGIAQELAGLVVTPTGVYLGGWVYQGPVNFVSPNRTTTKIMDASPDIDAFVAKLGLDGSYQSAFTVGVVGRTIDDSNTADPTNSGYAESGSGWKNQRYGFDSESRTHLKGTGSNTATWTFTGVRNGTYQVVTQFSAARGNATNAPFRVNGALVTVDQTIAPSDFLTENQFSWKNLGTFAVTNGTVTVVLSDAANGTVVADAVRIWEVAASRPQIASATASPNPVTAGSSVTLTTSNITDPNPGGTITQVAFYADSNNDGVLDWGDTLLGYGTQNPDGTWALTFSTTGWASGSHTLFAQAQDSYGALSDPLALNLTVM